MNERVNEIQERLAAISTEVESATGEIGRASCRERV